MGARAGERAVPPALVCSDCGLLYRPVAGHCRGGKYEGCCRSFVSGGDFDLHRVQIDQTDPNYARRCLTDDELTDAGWGRLDHYWLSPAALARREDGTPST